MKTGGGGGNELMYLIISFVLDFISNYNKYIYPYKCTDINLDISHYPIIDALKSHIFKLKPGLCQC